MNYVRSIEAGSVALEVEDGIDAEDLQALGARRKLFNRRRWVIGSAGDQDLAIILTALRDLGVAFAGGQGWPAAAQFKRLRDGGIIEGPYIEVVWRGPEQPETICHD